MLRHPTRRGLILDSDLKPSRKAWFPVRDPQASLGHAAQRHGQDPACMKESYSSRGAKPHPRR